MFSESNWEDSDVKSYSFKSFTKAATKSSIDCNKKEKRKQKERLKNESKIELTKKTVDKKKNKIKNKGNKDKINKLGTESETVLNAQKKSEGSLLGKLRDNLKGARFRYLNEQLYKTSSSGGMKLFEGKTEDFEAYHLGYRHQVEQWPMNPLRKIIAEVKKLPESLIIADFGCGDAMLAQSVPHKVYSIDLISVSDDVIASDMANTPLKTGSIDVAVYCLSLMGTNLQDFFLEANRVLRLGGLLIISEISSRFSSVNEFIQNVQKCGFHLERRELAHKMFVFFRFKKQQTVPKGNASVTSFSLKPCLYKKR